jgi:hypothetical protein
MPNIHCPSKAFGIGNYRVGPHHQPDIYPHDYAMSLLKVKGDIANATQIPFSRDFVAFSRLRYYASVSGRHTNGDDSMS